MSTTPIALTCGDPSGIGPEICVAAWSALRNAHPMVLLADPRHLPDDLPMTRWQPGDAVTPDQLSICALDFAKTRRPGVMDLANAPGTLQAIDMAIDLVTRQTASAMVTAPINKKVLQNGAGFGFPGHTEYLCKKAGVDQVVMMLASPELRVVPTTIHIPLADVARTLTPSLIQRTIEITASALQQDFGIAKPRLAVAGLDPHAGEGGNIGTLDRDMIAPAIAELKAQGYQLTGPMSADTMFHARARAGYDAAICMYHDQALIPIKTIDFDRGVNVTLGLPFIRTSPDHGTAYDIAGTGAADASSMIEAVKLASQMVTARGH